MGILWTHNGHYRVYSVNTKVHCMLRLFVGGKGMCLYTYNYYNQEVLSNISGINVWDT